MSQAPNS